MTTAYIDGGRIASNPVEFTNSIAVKWTESTREFELSANGNKLSYQIPNAVDIKIEDNVITLHAKADAPNSKALAGTFRSLISNAVKGLTTPWERKLLIEGVGYKVTPGKGPDKVSLHLGYSNPIEFTIDSSVKFEIVDPRNLLLKSYDKQLVGQVAAEIRSKRPPNSYNGKGVRYDGEVIILKEVGK